MQELWVSLYQSKIKEKKKKNKSQVIRRVESPSFESNSLSNHAWWLNVMEFWGWSHKMKFWAPLWTWSINQHMWSKVSEKKKEKKVTRLGFRFLFSLISHENEDPIQTHLCQRVNVSFWVKDDPSRKRNIIKKALTIEKGGSWRGISSLLEKGTPNTYIHWLCYISSINQPHFPL